MSAGKCNKCGESAITLFHGICKKCRKERELEFMESDIRVTIGERFSIFVDGEKHTYEVGKSDFNKIYLNEIFKGLIQTK